MFGRRGDVDASAALEFFFNRKHVAGRHRQARAECVQTAILFKDARGDFNPALFASPFELIANHTNVIGFNEVFKK